MEKSYENSVASPSYVSLLDFPIYLHAMKHPDKWTISKLRLNKCLHKDSLLFKTHKLR